MSSGFPWADEVKKEFDLLEKQEPGNPKHNLNRSSVFTDDMINQLNAGIAYKQSAALIFDSASAFFSRDNMALPGCAWFFKLLAMTDRADAYLAIEFVNKRGGTVDFKGIAEPPSEEKWHVKGMSDVLHAFTKALALAKVYYNDTHKAHAMAMKANDAHSMEFLECCIWETAEKMKCLAEDVTHLKTVQDDKHAIKNFDCELEKKCCDLAKYVAIEIGMPPCLQMGPMKRKYTTETMKSSLELWSLKEK